MNQPQQRPMSVQDAWQNIVNVVRAFSGNADTHDALRTSLEVLMGRVNLCAELEQQLPELRGKLEAALEKLAEPRPAPEPLPEPVSPPS